MSFCTVEKVKQSFAESILATFQSKDFSSKHPDQCVDDSDGEDDPRSVDTMSELGSMASLSTAVTPQPRSKHDSMVQRLDKQFGEWSLYQTPPKPLSGPLKDVAESLKAQFLASKTPQKVEPPVQGSSQDGAGKKTTSEVPDHVACQYP